MLIRKTAGFFLAALLLAASLLGVLLGLPRSAYAESSPVTLTTDNASLFLPESYEQYLALDNPSSIAMSGDYIVVADGHTLFIYDRAKGKYSQYEHQHFSQASTYADISKVQIAELEGAGNDRIFFSDGDLHLYEYQFNESATSQSMIINNLTAQSFLVDKAHNALFTANSPAGNGNVELTRYSLDDFKTSMATCSVPKANSPMLAVDGDTLYLVYNDTNLRTCPVDNLSDETISLISKTSVTGLQAVERYQGELYLTVKGQNESANGLYRSENGSAVRISLGNGNESEGLGALTVYQDKLYCVMGKSVCLLNVDGENNVTLGDFEIAAGSASVNRLSGATESVRAGDLLVTADTGNDRISVYDTAEKRYVTLSCANVSQVATDGAVIAAATDNSIFIYEKVLNSQTLVREFSCTKTVTVSHVAGVVCVYGAVYYVTSDFHYGKITRDDKGTADNGDDVWTEAPSTQRMGAIPQAITADLFGDIFVADQDGKVYEYREEAFTAGDTLGASVATIGKDFTSLRAGFDGKLYYLDADKNLHMHDGETDRKIAAIDGADFVYTGGAEKKPTSFALGYEDDEVYFCFGDFIVKSESGALGIATLESVSEEVLNASEGALSSVQAVQDVQFADFAAGAVGVHVDFGALTGEGGYCLGYERFSEARRGVLLASHGDYSLTALYHDHVYSVEIFRTADIAEKVPVQYDETAQGTKYLAGNCTPFHFPCILGAPARAESLPRGTQVRVLGVLNEGGPDAAQGGYDFAYIEYQTSARAVERGYVPLSFLTDIDPLGDGQAKAGYVRAGIEFTGSDGSVRTSDKPVLARLYENPDGSYRAVYVEDGVTYTATVADGDIEWNGSGASDAWRIALIVILSVLAVIIIGAYVYLLPRDKKNKK